MHKIRLKKTIIAAALAVSLLQGASPVSAESIIVGDAIVVPTAAPTAAPVKTSDTGSASAQTAPSTQTPTAAPTKSAAEQAAVTAAADPSATAATTPATPTAGQPATSITTPAAATTTPAADPGAAAATPAGDSAAANTATSAADPAAASANASADNTTANAPENLTAESGSNAAANSTAAPTANPAAEETAANAANAASSKSDSKHAKWYRDWKIHLLDMRDARKREHKETILKGRLKIELLSDGVELDEGADVYYLCDNGSDYVLAEQGGNTYVYQPCITRSGEYFLVTDTLNEAIVGHITPMVGVDHKHSTEEFWNHILLRDAPQRAYRFSRDRPKDANGVMMVPYYNQGRGYCVNGTWLFEDWPNATFNVNGHTMHEAGCGYFSTAMALSYVLQRIVSPVEFKENGQYIAGMGSMVTIGTVSAASYGVDAYITGDFDEVLMALRNGQPVMEHVGAPPFTNDGHYILLVGVLPDGTIAVNDPGHMDNSYWYCGVSWPVEVILGAVKNINTAFTVFG